MRKSMEQKEGPLSHENLYPLKHHMLFFPNVTYSLMETDGNGIFGRCIRCMKNSFI